MQLVIAYLSTMEAIEWTLNIYSFGLKSVIDDGFLSNPEYSFKMSESCPISLEKN